MTQRRVRGVDPKVQVTIVLPKSVLENLDKVVDELSENRNRSFVLETMIRFCIEEEGSPIEKGESILEWLFPLEEDGDDT